MGVLAHLSWVGSILCCRDPAPHGCYNGKMWHPSWACLFTGHRDLHVVRYTPFKHCVCMHRSSYNVFSQRRKVSLLLVLLLLRLLVVPFWRKNSQILSGLSPKTGLRSLKGSSLDAALRRKQHYLPQQQKQQQQPITTLDPESHMSVTRGD